MSFSPRIDRLETNSIINGAMELWQRGTSKIGQTSDQYTADRWSVGVSGLTSASYDNTRFSNVPVSAEFAEYSNRVACNTTQAASAGFEVNYQYVIEGYDLLPYVGKKMYIQFWAYADVAGVYTLRLTNSGNDQRYLREITIDNPLTWEFKQILIDELPLDSGTWNFTNGIGLTVELMLAERTDSTTSTFGVWGAPASVGFASANQVNLFTTTTQQFRLTEVMVIPVEPSFSLSWVPNGISFRRFGRNFGEELVAAQRYFEKNYPLDVDPGSSSSNGPVIAGGAANTFRWAGSHVKLQRKRNTPTVEIYSSTGVLGTVRDLVNSLNRSSNVSAVGETGFAVQNISGVNLQTIDVQFFWTADAEY